MSEKIMSIGVIGCGNISDAYFKGAQEAGNLVMKSCADLNPEAAQAKAELYGCAAVTVDELLADPEIELVVNLTIPHAHVAVGVQILEAGKHVYAEKPLAVTLEEADRLIEAAQRAGRRIGSAPDTFLFGLDLPLFDRTACNNLARDFSGVNRLKVQLAKWNAIRYSGN
jgi:predicted dehydrogenase